MRRLSSPALPILMIIGLAAFMPAALPGAPVPDVPAATRTVAPGADTALTAWRTPHGDWHTARSAALAPDNPARLRTEPGEGILVNGPTGTTSNLFTTDEYGDVEAHIEFMVPKGSNSGVYLMGRYEVQILDSFGVEAPGSGDCGGIYERWRDNRGYEGHAPRVNASLAPGEWQSFDIVFRAPRFDADGRKTSPATFVKVVHNGTLIHENVEVTGPTRAAAFDDEKPAGPLMLQGDHGPVAYRGIRLTVAEDEADDRTRARAGAAMRRLAGLEPGTTDDSGLAVRDLWRRGTPRDRLQLEDDLLGVLSGAAGPATAFGREQACRLLAEFGTARSLPLLADLVVRPETSHMARIALSGMSFPEAGNALIDAVAKTDGAVRIGILTDLAARREPRAVAVIAPLAASPDPATAEAALAALGRIGSADAARAVEGAAVPDDLRPHRAAALLACAETAAARGRTDEAGRLYRLVAAKGDPLERLAACLGLAAIGDPEAVTAVIAVLRSGDARTSRRVASAIPSLAGGEASTRQLAALLPALPPPAARALLTGLAARGDRAAVPAVLAVAGNPDSPVREAAVRALGDLGGADAVGALARYCGEDGPTADIAEDVLRTGSGDNISETLAGLLDDAEVVGKAVLIRVLAARGAKVAIPALVRSLEDSESSVRREALEALGDLGGQPEIPALTAFLGGPPSEPEASRAEKALTRVLRRAYAEPGEAGAAAAELYGGAPAPALPSLLSVMGAFGGPKALACALGAAKGADDGLRAAAIRALTEWPDVGPLAFLLETAGDAPDPIVRVKCLRGFVRLMSLPSDRAAEETVALYGRAMDAAERTEEKELLLRGAAESPSLHTVGFVKSRLGDPEVGDIAAAAYADLCLALRDVRVLENAAEFPAETAAVSGPGAVYEAAENRRCIGSWTSPDATVRWEFVVLRPGSYSVTVRQSMLGYAGSRYAVEVGASRLEGEVVDTGGWDRFAECAVGTVELPAGPCAITVRVLNKPSDYVMNLRGLTLRRQGYTGPADVGAGKPVLLAARDAEVGGGGTISYERPAEKNCIGNWNSADAYVTWQARLPAPGVYAVEAEIAVIDDCEGSRFRVSVGDDGVEGVVKGTGSWTAFRRDLVGALRTDRAGDVPVRVSIVRSTSPHMMNLRSIVLTPVRMW